MSDLHDVDILTPPTYEPGGETEDIVQAIREGHWLHVTNLWIWRRQPDIAILFQQRDANSPFAPTLLDCSVGGYLMAGESGADGAVRELQEELGLRVPADQLTSLGRHFNAGLDQTGRERRRVINTFCLEWNHDLSDISMNPHEVPAVFWVSTETLLGIERAGEAAIGGLAADGTALTRHVTKDDFVYNVDRLHYRIAEQIERLAIRPKGP